MTILPAPVPASVGVTAAAKYATQNILPDHAAHSRAARLRGFGYGGYGGVLVAVTVFGATSPTQEGCKPWFVEGSLVECLQAVHLGIAVAVFACAAVRSFRAGAEERWMVAIFLLGTCFALHREFDFMWKRRDLDLIYHSIKVVIGLPLVAIFCRCFPSMFHLWLQRPLWLPYTFLFVAIGGYAVAQLVTPVLDLFGVRSRYTRTSEEAIELLPGVFFVFAAIELLFRASPDLLERHNEGAAAAAPRSSATSA
jgi:hypothetical protein